MNEGAQGGIPTHQPPAKTAQGPSSHPPNTGEGFSTGEEHAPTVRQSPPVFEEPEIVNIDDLEADDIVIAYVISLHSELSNVTFPQCHGSNRLRQEHGETDDKQWNLVIDVSSSSCAVQVDATLMETVMRRHHLQIRSLRSNSGIKQACVT